MRPAPAARPWPEPTRLADPPRVLLLFCHPNPHRSRVNRALRAQAEGVPGVSLHDLYERYPDGALDVAWEQELLLTHRALVLQHPFYWYSVPPLLKEWLDRVLLWGWAYGRSGDKLRGKLFLQAITTGGPAASYQPDGPNRFTIAQLLAPMEQTAHLCGMRWQEPFVVHGTHRLTDAELAGEAQRYRQRLSDLAREVSV